MRRFFALLLCAVMAASLLAGCDTDKRGEEPGNFGDSQNSAGGGAPAAPTPDETPGSGGGTGSSDPAETPGGGEPQGQEPGESGDGESAEADPRPDMSYEHIAQVMSGTLVGYVTMDLGGFSYDAWTEDGDGRVDIMADDPVTGKLEVPSFVEHFDVYLPVTQFGLGFDEVEGITEIAFPKYILSVNTRAKLERTAWYQALPDGPVYLGQALYGYKGEMPENYDLVVEDGTKAIMDEALQGQEHLRSVTLPDSVVYLGHRAFSGCIYLCRVNMSRNLMWMGEGVFGDCQTMMDVFIPSTLTYSGYSAFGGLRSDFTVWYEGEGDDFDLQWRDENVNRGCTFEEYAAQMPAVPEDVMGLANLANIPVGGYVVFGSYEQDNDASNGPERLRWRVMSTDGEYALLITEDVIDGVPYFADETMFSSADQVVNDRGLETREEKYGRVSLIVTWDKSTIRDWLNGEFYDTAFTDGEKAQIVENETVTPPYAKDDPGCPTTYDKVFLPTMPELRESTHIYGGDMTSASLTVYAEKNRGDEDYWLRSNDVLRVTEDTNAHEADDPQRPQGVRPVIRVRIPCHTGGRDVIK